MIQDEQQTEVSFTPEEAAAVGDPAAAGTEPIEAAAVDVGPTDAGATEEPPAQSPAGADQRAAEEAESPPFAQIAGAFVGAFVAAKLLGKLGGGGD